jgi:hypothetical protein
MSGIDVERDGRGVVTLWLDNPARRNALSNAMVFGLCETLGALASDPEARVIVLRGRGGAFCAGADLNDIRELQAADPDTVRHMYAAMQRIERGDLLRAAAGGERGREIRPRHRHDDRHLDRHRTRRGESALGISEVHHGITPMAPHPPC